MKTVIPIIMQPDTEKYFWVRSVLDGIRSSAARYDYELLVADRDIISKGFLPKNRPVLVNGHMAEWLSDTAVFLWLNGYILWRSGYRGLLYCWGTQEYSAFRCQIQGIGRLGEGAAL